MLGIVCWVSRKNCITKMTNTRLEYNKRLQEVEVYFSTLKLLDSGNCSIKCVDILGKEIIKAIDNELSTILKANGFLLLYNLVESTIRKSVDAILNSIHNTSVTFGDLSKELKKLWIKQEGRNANSDKILTIANIILENKLLTFKRDCVNISGNIDAQEIRKILKQVGGGTIENGRRLKDIKDKRNYLAHGDFSFSEIGKDYSVNDLVKYKDDTKEYLSKVLDEIQSYIDNQKFLNI